MNNDALKLMAELLRVFIAGTVSNVVTHQLVSLVCGREGSKVCQIVEEGDLKGIFPSFKNQFKNIFAAITFYHHSILILSRSCSHLPFPLGLQQNTNNIPDKSKFL